MPHNLKKILSKVDYISIKKHVFLTFANTWHFVCRKTTVETSLIFSWDTEAFATESQEDIKASKVDYISIKIFQIYGILTFCNKLFSSYKVSFKFYAF